MAGLVGASQVQGQPEQPETGSMAHQYDSGTQRAGRFLQAITGFQMTNDDLVYALGECKRESGTCTTYCSESYARWNSTYNCPSNEESYGALATWDISSVTSLWQGEKHPTFAFVVRINGVHGQEGLIAVSFGWWLSCVCCDWMR